MLFTPTQCVGVGVGLAVLTVGVGLIVLTVGLGEGVAVGEGMGVAVGGAVGTSVDRSVGTADAAGVISLTDPVADDDVAVGTAVEAVPCAASLMVPMMPQSRKATSKTPQPIPIGERYQGFFGGGGCCGWS